MRIFDFFCEIQKCGDFIEKHFQTPKILKNKKATKQTKKKKSIILRYSYNVINQLNLCE